MSNRETDFLIEKAMGYVEIAATEAVNALCALTRLCAGWDFNNHHYLSGLGEVYNLLSDLFEKDRIESAFKNVIVKIHITIKKLFARKTTRSIIEPVRNKGWKGGR